MNVDIIMVVQNEGKRIKTSVQSILDRPTRILHCMF